MPKALPGWLLPGNPPKKQKRTKALQQDAAVRRQKVTGTADQPYAQSQIQQQPEPLVQLESKLQLDEQAIKCVTSTKRLEELTNDAVKVGAVVKHVSVLQAKQNVAAAALVAKQLVVVKRASKQFVVARRLMKRSKIVERVGSKIVKRVDRFRKTKASERCGHCKTCMNRSMKKACLVLRARMESASSTAAIPNPTTVHECIL